MCGRFEFNTDQNIEEIHKIVQVIKEKYDDDIFFHTGAIFPTNKVPVLATKDGKFSLQLMQWGFPKWDGKGTVFNARSESALQKEMFADSLLTRRCVVITTGFYEWQKIGATAKTKYFFTSRHNPVLYMAGIYKTIQIGDETKDCFVVLTREANQYINDIHNRMPVILYKNELKDWLSGGKFVKQVFDRDNIELERKIVTD